ncbi:MAG: aspartate aminotransferase family protein [Eubacteriales bacterium]|nr:aspartate aminotransferase family protein [Eubacteriales bacterium]
MNEINDPKLQSIIATDDAYYLQAFGHRTPLCVDYGQGVYLFDTAGKRYFDMIGGIAVNVLGHAHPALTQAIALQAGKVIHCSNYFYNEPQARLAQRLGDLFGEGRVFFNNSGAEANETAIKLARGYFFKKGQPRAKIVTALQSFHGRTLATATATGQTKYSAPFAPLPEGFVYVPYNDVAALEAAVDDQTCAVMLELIQGESGVHPATLAYVDAAVAACFRTGARLIIDEIQTGVGRTGKFLASQLYGIKPHIVTLAKGLAGGVPIGVAIADQETATGFTPGDHGSTFGGNPLACAASLAVLDTLEQGHLVQKAAGLGDYFREVLTAIAEQTGLIKQIRGAGLMLGVELTLPIAADVKHRCLEQGYLIGIVGTHTLRLLPPLIIERDHIDAFATTLTAILQEATAQ